MAYCHLIQLESTVMQKRSSIQAASFSSGATIKLGHTDAATLQTVNASRFWSVVHLFFAHVALSPSLYCCPILSRGLLNHAGLF
jgi:hypothetical protein